MAEVGGFNVSNIQADQDRIEEEREKDEKRKGTVDYTKLEATIAEQKELAGKVIETAVYYLNRAEHK